MFNKYIILIFLVYALAAPQECIGKAAFGWVLRQNGDVMGERRLLVTANAIRIDSIKGGYSIVSQGPSWTVTIFNRRSNKFIQMPYASFRGETMTKLYSGDKRALSAGVWKKAAAEEICGQATSSFKMLPNQNSKIAGTSIKLANYNILSGAELAIEAFGIVRLVYQLPPIKGIPVKLAFLDGVDNYTVHPVNTSQIKKMALADSEFALPPGLIRTTDQMEVFVDPLSKQAYDGFTGWTAPDLGTSRR